MDKSRLTFLFHRYVDRACKEEEKKEFLELVSDNANNEQLKHLMQDLWDKLPAESELKASKAKGILSNILQDPLEKEVKVPKRGKNWMKIAASVALVIVSIGITYLYFHSMDNTITTTDNIVKTENKQQFIELPDGSSVALNKDSRLLFPKTFEGQSVREVTLIGEGFFDIEHDPNKPFIVNTGKLKTTVLGTAFNIKAQLGEKNITITVIRGKVKVEDGEKLMGIITPNQQMEFDQEIEKAEHITINGKKTIKWLEKDIYFDNISMIEASKQLEKRFDIKIKFENEKLMRNCFFTATFIHGESLDQILEVICQFNSAHFKKDRSGIILISGEGC